MWETDPDPEAHFTPGAFLNLFLTSRGLPPDGVHVEPVVVAAFQYPVYRALVGLASARPAAAWIEPRRFPLAHGSIEGAPLSVTLLPVGAPAAVMHAEVLIAAGARALITVGSAGSLQPDLPIGSLVLPTGATREEGTSFHYAPSTVDAGADSHATDVIRETCSLLGLSSREGRVWTTDAPFRETRARIDAHARQGTLAVDMEASALFVLGAARGIAVGSLFIISDELYRPWRLAYFDAAYQERATLAAEAVLRAGATLRRSFPESVRHLGPDGEVHLPAE